MGDVGAIVTVPDDEADSEATVAVLIVVALSTEDKAGLIADFWNADGIA